MSRRREVDFVVIQLVSLVKIKGIVLPPEIDEICVDLDDNQKMKVFKKLKRKKIVLEDGMLQYSKHVVGDEEIRAKELRSYIGKKNPMIITSDNLKIGPRVTEGIVATSFPELTREEWLSKLMKEKENFDFTMYITPNSQRPTEIYLASHLKQVEKELHSLIQKGLEEEDEAKTLAERKKELMQKLDYLRQGKYKLFKMALYILSKGVNEDTAKKLSKKIMSTLHSGGIEGKFATNYQKQLFMSMIPTGIDRLEGRRIVVPSTTAAASFPFRKR